MHPDGKSPIRVKVVIENTTRTDWKKILFHCNISDVFLLPPIKYGGNYLITARIVEYRLSPSDPLKEIFQVRRKLKEACRSGVQKSTSR